MRDKTAFSRWISLLGVSLLTVSFLWIALESPFSVARGQDKSSTPQTNPNPPAGKTGVGPNADSIKPYRPAPKDPFQKKVKPKESREGPKNNPIKEPPALAQRRLDYQRKVRDAELKGIDPPDPVTQYLVRELDVIGYFQDSQGPGAFVRAQGTGTSFFVRRGTRCYDGQVLQIDGGDTGNGTPSVTFREVVFFQKGNSQDNKVTKSAAPASK